MTLDTFLTPELVVSALILTALLGGAAGWWLHAARSRTRRQASDAYYAEVVKAASHARERARQEKALLEQQLGRLRDEHAHCGTRGEAIERTLKERDDAIAGLRKELAAALSNLSGAGEELRDLKERLRAERATQAKAAKADGKPPWLKAKSNERDDLQAIRGLGPVIEERLNALGIRQYRQLAQMTADQAGWLASRINIMPSRIRRDAWADQAREMHYLKYKKRV